MDKTQTMRKWIQNTFHISYELWKQVDTNEVAKQAIVESENWKDETLFKIIYKAGAETIMGPVMKVKEITLIEEEKE